MTSIKSCILKVILILMIIQFIFGMQNISHAAFWDDIFSSASDFFNQGKETAGKGQIAIEDEEGNKTYIETPKSSEITTIINNIYNIVFPLGVAVTVIVGGALGIKFMMASVEDRAKIKESLVPYIAGCIAIYGAFGIWKLAITVFSSIS